MADLLTIAQVNAELAATAAYDVDNDLALAKRRVAALRRKMDFAQQMGRDSQLVAFDLQRTENQLAEVKQWLAANGGASNDATKSASCIHADYSDIARF
jgi:hypothetical protein